MNIHRITAIFECLIAGEGGGPKVLMHVNAYLVAVVEPGLKARLTHFHSLGPFRKAWRPLQLFAEVFQLILQQNPVLDSLGKVGLFLNCQ